MVDCFRRIRNEAVRVLYFLFDGPERPAFLLVDCLLLFPDELGERLCAFPLPFCVEPLATSGAFAERWADGLLVSLRLRRRVLFGWLLRVSFARPGIRMGARAVLLPRRFRGSGVDARRVSGVEVRLASGVDARRPRDGVLVRLEPPGWLLFEFFAGCEAARSL